jgi:hypothetical protein
MNTATRIPASIVEAKTLEIRVASPLSGIHMSPHERRQAERDMRAAEQLVDFAFDVIAGCQAFVRRLRRVSVAH